MHAVDPAERREHPRIPCDLQVSLTGRDETFELSARDVSVGGVFLFSKKPVSLNQAVTLKFSAGESTVEAKGTVVHHLRQVGFGVRFDVLSEADQDRLGAFLAESGGEL